MVLGLFAGGVGTWLGQRKQAAKKTELDPERF